MTPQQRQRLRIAALLAGARLTAPLSTRGAGWFAARLWFTPWAVPRSNRTVAREQEWLAPTSARTWTVEGRQLTGFEAGTGPTVLLVHGWGDRSAVMGGFIAPLVAAGFRVVAFDLPAHDGSGRGETDIPEVARVITAMAAEVGEVAGVVAHSLGGAATVAALGAGLRAERVALLAPAVRLDAAVDRFTRMFGMPSRAVAGLRRNIERRFGATIWDDYANDRIAAGLSTPALIVHDTEDPQVDLADAHLLAGAWAGSRLLVTSGLGHRRILWDDAVVTAVADFMAAGRTDGSATPLRRRPEPVPSARG